MDSLNRFQSIPLFKAVVSYHVSGTSKIPVELVVRLPRRQNHGIKITSRFVVVVVLSEDIKTYFPIEGGSRYVTGKSIFTKRSQETVYE